MCLKLIYILLPLIIVLIHQNNNNNNNNNLDAQESFMAHIQGCKKINKCSRFSIDEKDLDKFSKLLLQMDLLEMVYPYDPTQLLLTTNGVSFFFPKKDTP